MHRKFLIAGNWKMNNGVADSVSLVDVVKNRTSKILSIDMLVCPPFTALDAVHKAVAGSLLRVGAQNIYLESKGACAGEVSFSILRDCNISHVISGHSERRTISGENNKHINKKCVRH
jgi:triosephosphate isomerase